MSQSWPVPACLCRSPASTSHSPCLSPQVPSLNTVPLHHLKPDGLVRFRCMVQDMFDPEFYMGVFETVDPRTNTRVSDVTPRIHQRQARGRTRHFTSPEVSVRLYRDDHNVGDPAGHRALYIQRAFHTQDPQCTQQAFHTQDPQCAQRAFHTQDPLCAQRFVFYIFCICFPFYFQTLHFGKYRDVADCAQPQEVDVDSNRSITAERQTFYCVPIPGESLWVKETYSSQNQAHTNSTPTSITPSRPKRSFEEMGHHEEVHTETKKHGPEPPSAQQTPMSCTGTAPIDLNFPLPGEKGPACLVKVYENWDRFKVNDVIEVFGVLCADPHLSAASDDGDSASVVMDPLDGMDTAEERRVHSPPTSLVPRIHAIVIRRLDHNNPLMPPGLQETTEGRLFVSSFVSEVSLIRAELRDFLTHTLLGDSLAAEYLLLHLISTVYARRDVLALGKFTLNLSGCPRSATFTEFLYRVLQQLVPMSYYLSMTIENMNLLRFIPRKDYTANRLVSGILQLPVNTSILVDETVLEQGQLDTAGVRNVTALGNVITWQKVDYDFSFHQMEFPCNINVLVTSEGRALLPSDCQIPLRPQTAPSSMERYVEALLASALPSLLNKFRVYLSALRFLEYSITDEVTKAVEDDFVEIRRMDPHSMSADDLHRLLVVARLVSLSAGQTTLSQERWLHAKQLEEQRKGRLQEHTYVNGNEP
uniref:Mini-chromosome maintenance complex-binding protein n=1 Tax=Leptobrachium leishanense TaxID=445787 RepID=A0A8C5RAN8_9ANUR